jgi:hypothetical protein
MEVDDAEFLRWAESTTVGKHTKAILFYNSGEPSLMGNVDDIMRNLDLLVWTAAGPRLVFGADVVAGTPQLSTDAIEFNGVDRLFGIAG